MSKFVNKSIRFDMDSSIIRDFLAAQTNFSKAIKFLIFDYCSKNQIEDLSKKLKEISTKNANILLGYTYENMTNYNKSN